MGSYINGTSYVLRKADDPFQNLFNDEQIITKSKVENMEKRLKKDVMNECRVVENGCNIVVQREETIHNVRPVIMNSYLDSQADPPCKHVLPSHHARNVLYRGHPRIRHELPSHPHHRDQPSFDRFLLLLISPTGSPLRNRGYPR